MIRIGAPRIIRDEQCVLIETRVTTPKHADEVIWYRLPPDVGTTEEMAADALFIVGLVLAMGAKSSLQIDTRVAPELLENSRQLQEILTRWHPKSLARVEVIATARDRSGAFPQ